MFASLNSCRGNTKSRRDDIQSLLYIMIYLLNGNHLPWDDFHRRFKEKNYQFKDFLVERLKIKYSQYVYKDLPHGLKPIFKKIFTLQFEEEPPYEALISDLKREFLREISEQDPSGLHQFEWVKKEKQNMFKQFNDSGSADVNSLCGSSLNKK